MPRPTQALDPSVFAFSYGTFTLSGQAVQTCSDNKHFFACRLAAVEAYNPILLAVWFGLLRVRSPLLAEYSLFLRILGCFGSPGALL